MFTKSKETAAVQGTAVGTVYQYTVSYDTDGSEALNIALAVSKSVTATNGTVSSEDVGTISNDGDKLNISIPQSEDIAAIVADYVTIVAEVGGIHIGASAGL